MTDKYEFIDGEKDLYPIVATCACGWMCPRSGFYDWGDRPGRIGDHTSTGKELKVLITQSFTDSDRGTSATAGCTPSWAGGEGMSAHRSWCGR